MGKQSLTHPSRHARALFQIAILLLFALWLNPKATAQSTTDSTLPLILPSAIAYNSTGNLYIADTGHHIIRKLDPAGNLTTIAGTGVQGFSGDNGPATTAQLDSPQGLALDAANNLYIADTHNRRIRKLDLATNLITTIAGTTAPSGEGDNGPAATARLNLPIAIAVGVNNLYIADTADHRIRKVNLTTSQISIVAGTGIQGYSGDNGPAISATIDSPTGLALDSANNLYLADTHNHRIRRIDVTTGLITTIAGTGISSFSGDNIPATNSSLALPHGLTIDASGNLFVADTSNHRIRRIDAATGLITTVIGTGTQGFSGDIAPAVSATLDSPRATTLSSTDLLTFADTSNQRIRQLTAQPAPATTIQTIAGLGSTNTETLTLTDPGEFLYGTGTITASLSTETPATGLITFLDTGNAKTITLSSTPLITNTATLNTSTLPAGIHLISAIYPGDQTHAAAKSSSRTLTIEPKPLIATAAPIAIPYGQSIPAITGTLVGLLPQDASNLTATFTTSATALSPVGTYLLSASINGSAAGNYALTVNPAILTINPASTQTILFAPTSPIAPGTAVTFGIHVASTTTGTPTGTVTLDDSSNPLLTLPISSTGDVSFTTGILSQGTHSLIALYSGSSNFSRSASSPTIVTIGVPTSPNFTLASTGTTTQSIVAGNSATYTFAVQTQGNLSSPIALTATGLPHLATASFNPAYLPPGTAGTFTLTISTPKATAFQQDRTPPILWTLLLFPFAGLKICRRHRAKTAFRALATLTILMAFCIGCGDRINSSSGQSTSPKTYDITVTGTATTASSATLQHSATVSLALIAAN